MVCEASECPDEPGDGTSLSFGAVSDGSLEVYMANDAPVAGFQFDISGISISGASGGSAEAAGFMISTSESTVIGFSLTGATIPAGEGVLVNVSFTGSGEACLENAVLSDSDGNSLDTDLGDCVTIGGGGTDSVDINYSSGEEIAGFQFDVEGVSILSAGGGAAEAAGFMISTSESTVIGFSLTGATIPAGEGVLVVLEVEGDGGNTQVTNVVFSDSDGNPLDTSVEGGTTIVVGGEPELPSVTINSPADGAMLYGMNIDVSVSGSNLSAGDHYHAYLDGALAGMFYEDNFSISASYGDHNLTVIVADGAHQDYEHDGASDSASFTNMEETTDGNSLGFGEVGESSLQILMTNETPVAGFQFDIDGITITGASGGSAEAAGFMISTSESTVIGFSLTGATIPEGSGVLVDVNFTGSGLACLENVVLSDSNGTPLEVEVGDCVQIGDEPEPPAAPTDLGADAGDGSVQLAWAGSEGAESYNIYREQQSTTGMGCEDQGYEFEDCVGFCFNEEDCTNGSCLDWVGDGYCDDGTWGLNLNCEEWDFDGGDCYNTNCDQGYVDDCAGDGDCCPESWINDGYCDDENQTWGCDLMCFDAEASDCGGRTTPEGSKVSEAIKFVISDGYNNYSFNSGTVDADKELRLMPSTDSREYVLIASTGNTSYTDSDVVNGTEYCYYTTAVNDAGESGASNMVCATPEGGGPAGDVVLGIDDLDLDAGSTGNVALTMDNEDGVAGFQFNLSASADIAEIVNITTTDRTEGFTVSWANNTVVGFSLTGAVIEPGSGAFLNVEVLGTAGGSAEVCYSEVVLSDSDGDALPSDTSCGMLTVTEEPVETVAMSVGNGYGTTGGEGSVEVSMDNSNAVGGFQFYLDIDPALATLVSAETTDRTDGFNVSTANGIVLVFSLTGDSIEPGSGPVVNLNLYGDAEGVASLSIENLVVSDPAGNSMPTETSSGSFTVESGAVEGCMDPEACNYDPYANVDGDCWYANEGCECDDGEGADVDECGVCNGDGTSCPWTELNAEGGENQITLTWDGMGDNRSNFSLSLDNVNPDAGTLDIHMENSSEVAGFQFDVNGISISGASGGSAEANGFMLSTSGTTVLGFSLTGGTIPAGSGTLLSVAYSGFSGEICLGGAVLSDPNGQSLDVELGACYPEDTVETCDDMDACNYGEEGDCVYGGMCWDGSYECDASDCPEEPSGGTSLSIGAEGNGTVEVVMSNDTPVAGFQFDISNLTITGASGGSAEENGFMISTSGSTVIGFSLTGATIPAGTAVLVDVAFTDLSGEACIENAVLSDSNGNALDVDLSDGACFGGIVLQCEDPDACNFMEDGDCDYGTMCWDGSYECNPADCPGDDPEYTYNVYRDGELHTSGLENAGFVDDGLGYAESHCYTVTYVNNIDGLESHHSNEACATTDEMTDIPGCTIEAACNYDEEATVDNGTCWFASDGCSCEDGEGAEVDECGVCNGPGDVYECGCSDIPDGDCD